MLRDLHIQNLVVARDVSLTFAPGLNVLSGSTGAGKSLIMSALNLLLGERGSARAIREGENRAVIEGIFDLARPVGATGLVTAERTLTIRRELTASGRGHTTINGVTCTLKQLREVAVQLIEPHGQNEQLQLRQPESHRVYVDRLAGNADEQRAYADALDAYTEASGRIKEFDARIELLKEKRELLEHRLGELDRAAIAPGEKQTLESSLRLMENAQQIFDTLTAAIDGLYDGESSAFETVSRSRHGLARFADVDAVFGRLSDQLEEAEIALKESVSDMRAMADRMEFDPDHLQASQQRLATIVELERRYGAPIDSLLEDAARWRSELESIGFEDEERAHLVAAKEKCVRTLQTAAVHLTATRRRAAKRLDRAMTAELQELMMPGATFRTDVSCVDDPHSDLVVGERTVAVGPDGVDAVVFHVRTNPGESEGSVAEVASSGELSRIALALKKIVSLGREGTVLVLDELDSGVGGDLGEMIADRLDALTERHQIICITHMPHIAARADHHLIVSKRTSSGRTFTDITPARDEIRLHEIARMLGGAHGSDKRLELAAEMLHKGKNRSKTKTARP